MAITKGERTGSATYSAIKLAGLAGLVSIALGIAGAIVDEMQTFPGTGASASEIAGYVDAHRSALLVAMVLSTIAVGLWLAFGVGVWFWLRERTGSESVLFGVLPGWARQLRHAPARRLHGRLRALLSCTQRA